MQPQILPSEQVSRTKKNLETLTAHQEESLTSVDQNDNLEAKGTEKENVVLYDDSYPHEKENETTTEDKLSRSIHQDSQEELPTTEVHDDTMGTPGIANFDVYDDLVDASIIQSLDGIEKLESDDNLEEEPANDVNSVIPDSDLQEAAINESDIDDKETQEFLESFTYGKGSFRWWIGYLLHLYFHHHYRLSLEKF